jgi:hypothetical protein
MIVGLKGKIGSGKTTLAQILKDKFGFIEYAMADPIKKIALILGFTKSEVYGTQAEKMARSELWGVSGRHFMQTFGTDICREILPTKIPEMSGIWVRLFHEFLSSTDFDVVVSDVRFLSEEKAVRDNGGIIIEIVRDEWLAVDNHSSETEQDLIRADHIIENRGTLEDLEAAVMRIIQVE